MVAKLYFSLIFVHDVKLWYMISKRLGKQAVTSSSRVCTRVSILVKSGKSDIFAIWWGVSYDRRASAGRRPTLGNCGLKKSTCHATLFSSGEKRIRTRFTEPSRLMCSVFLYDHRNNLF